jgi:pectinesterase
MRKWLFIFICSIIALSSFGQAKPPADKSSEIIVAADGSGNYKTVQQAFDAVPNDNKTPVTIFIKNGVYKEKLQLGSAKKMLTIIGEDKFNTILTYDDHTGTIAPGGAVINTRTSHSF